MLTILIYDVHRFVKMKDVCLSPGNQFVQECQFLKKSLIGYLKKLIHISLKLSKNDLTVDSFWKSQHFSKLFSFRNVRRFSEATAHFSARLFLLTRVKRYLLTCLTASSFH